jgi:hypothetical protein
MNNNYKHDKTLDLDPSDTICWNFFGFHRDDRIFESKKLTKRISGYEWYLPRAVLPYVYLDKGLMYANKNLKENEKDNPMFRNCVYRIIHEFNIDMKYFMYKHYPIIFPEQKGPECKFSSFILYLQLLFKTKYKINIVISEDLKKFGIEKQKSMTRYEIY